MMSLVACFGNPHRGDDAFGPRVADALRAESAPGIRVAVLRDDALALLEEWRGHDHVVIVDALSADRSPGTLLHFDVTDAPVPADLRASSTHALGPAGAVEMARALGALPAKVEFLVATGSDFGHGKPLSVPMEAAVSGAVERILALIGSGG